MQLVLLAGELGEKYGKQHEYYNLRTPADAIKLLCFNYPKLKQELCEAHKNGVGYKVIQGGASMGYDELHLPFGSKPLLVVPVITGSGGRGVQQILFGAGLIASSFLLPGAGLFGATSIFGASAVAAGAAGATATGVALTALGTSLSAVGAGLILQGTANLLSPQPQLGNLGANRIRGEGTNVRGTGPEGVTRGGSGQQSYAFTGPANTVGTGATIPVIYGRVITGGHLLAANVEVADDSDPLKLETRSPGLQTLRINGQKLKRELKSLGGLKTLTGSETDLVVNSSDSEKKKKVVINKVFGPSDNKPLEAGEILEEEGLQYFKNPGKRKKIDVIFQINKGLFDFAGAKGSTKIDGFINYQIKLEVTQDEDDGGDVVAASASATVQGLLLQTQDVTFGHRLEMPRIDKGKKVKISVEILDAAVHENAKLKLQAYGYSLLEGKD
jgi:predicted phage tail protein